MDNYKVPELMDEKSRLLKPEIIISNNISPKTVDGNVHYGGVNDDVPLLGSRTDEPFDRLRFLRSLTIEPVMFAFCFAFTLNMSCLTNMMMDKGCLHHLNFSKEICDNMSGHPTEKAIVEKLANNYALYSNLMSLIAACTMIFIAPWSDKYGRKLPLLMACFGVFLTDASLVLCTISFDSQLFYLVLARIPSEIFGGIICVFTIVYSLSSEVSTARTRTLKYTMVELSLGLGMALGSLTGGILYRYYGYLYVYLTATVLHLACIPWIVLVVEETTGLDIKASWKKKVCDIFACESFSKSWGAATRARKNNERALLLLLFASMCIMVLSYESFGSIGFVYVHHIYDWDPMTYNTVNTIFVVSGIGFLAVCTPLLIRVFKVSDYALGLVGTTSMVLRMSILSFAKYKVFLYYIGNICGFCTGFTNLALRSGISKIVDKSELGLIFSFLATCESIFPMFGTILITKVFNATIDIVPSISYLMTAALLFLVPFLTFLWAYLTFSKPRHPNTYPKIN